MILQLQDKFKEIYRKNAQNNFFTPGRVNLIGEHIDYNGGLVMPCAISMGTWLLIAPNKEEVIRLASLNFKETINIPIQDIGHKENSAWYNYPLGIIYYLIKAHKVLKGLDLLYYGNIPIGSGLSSSASIEIVTAFALNDYFNLGYTKLELVKMAKWVENEYIGVNSGIMDQFAVTFGQANKAMILNCDSLDYELVDFDLDNYNLAIINTNKPRTLADSKYNERVNECKLALEILNTEGDLNNLCDLNADQYQKKRHLIQSNTIRNRADHVIFENERVHQAKNALTLKKLKDFGNLMYESHNSLKNLYEVSGVELDTIIEFCQSYDQVIGARMTGAGFGGCAIALVENGFEEPFKHKLNNYYEKKIGYSPAVYWSKIGSGAIKL